MAATTLAVASWEPVPAAGSPRGAAAAACAGMAGVSRHARRDDLPEAAALLGTACALTSCSLACTQRRQSGSTMIAHVCCCTCTTALCQLRGAGLASTAPQRAAAHLARFCRRRSCRRAVAAVLLLLHRAGLPQPPVAHVSAPGLIVVGRGRPAGVPHLSARSVGVVLSSRSTPAAGAVAIFLLR